MGRPPAMARIRLGAALGACALACSLLGCDSGAGGTTPAASSGALPPSPLARIAIGGPLDHVDPIYAHSQAERLVSRQIYDPLVARLDSPLGTVGRHRGPARPIHPVGSSPNWSFQLRPGARFHDGTPINADAVIANARRWFASGLVAARLPQLEAVDTPLPGQVRFQLSGPIPDLPARLSDPRFGLVAPATLAEHGTDEIPDGAGGSGAYRPAVLGRHRVVLQAADQWWGSAAGLGPGIDRIDVLAIDSARRRAALLRDGAVDIADDLDKRSAAAIANQPSLVSTTQGDSVVGASGAVRGLRGSSSVQPLSEVWLTTLR